MLPSIIEFSSKVLHRTRHMIRGMQPPDTRRTTVNRMDRHKPIMARWHRIRRPTRQERLIEDPMEATMVSEDGSLNVQNLTQTFMF